MAEKYPENFKTKVQAKMNEKSDAELTEEYGLSRTTLYRWRAQKEVLEKRAELTARHNGTKPEVSFESERLAILLERIAIASEMIAVQLKRVADSWEK